MRGSGREAKRQKGLGRVANQVRADGCAIGRTGRPSANNLQLWTRGLGLPVDQCHCPHRSNNCNIREEDQKNCDCGARDEAGTGADIHGDNAAARASTRPFLSAPRGAAEPQIARTAGHPSPLRPPEFPLQRARSPGAFSGGVSECPLLIVCRAQHRMRYQLDRPCDGWISRYPCRCQSNPSSCVPEPISSSVLEIGITAACVVCRSRPCCRCICIIMNHIACNTDNAASAATGHDPKARRGEARRCRR